MQINGLREVSLRLIERLKNEKVNCYPTGFTGNTFLCLDLHDIRADLMHEIWLHYSSNEFSRDGHEIALILVDMKIELGTANFILNGLRGKEQEKRVAFRRLHDDLWKPLCRRLRSVERCSEEAAEDIVQETFIRIFKAAEENNLPQPEALFSWVLIISKRIYIDKWRTKATEQSSELRKVKDSINAELKKLEKAYTEAMSSGDPVLTNLAYEKLALVKQKSDAINGDYGTLEFDEAIAEYSDPDMSGESSIISSYEDMNGVIDENISRGSMREKLNDCIMGALLKLSKVSAERAEALSLDFDGISSKEIAQIINRTEQATRQFLSESRKAFRKYSEPCRNYYETA